MEHHPPPTDVVTASHYVQTSRDRRLRWREHAPSFRTYFKGAEGRERKVRVQRGCTAWLFEGSQNEERLVECYKSRRGESTYFEGPPGQERVTRTVYREYVVPDGQMSGGSWQVAFTHEAEERAGRQVRQRTDAPPTAETLEEESARLDRELAAVQNELAALEQERVAPPHGPAPAPAATTVRGALSELLDGVEDAKDNLTDQQYLNLSNLTMRAWNLAAP